VPILPAPDDGPPGPRLKQLGVTGRLFERRYFLAEDGKVWCRESALGGWWTPRWLAVPAEDLGRVRLDGRTLAEVIGMVRQADLDAPTDLVRRPQDGSPLR
jgi:hypothetical protein